MRLIAQKPCKFGGKQFLGGEEIPVALVENPKAQVKRGVIAIADGGLSPTELQEVVTQRVKPVFEVLIHTEAEDLPLYLTNDELSVFTEIRQIGVNSSEDKQKISELIRKVESEDLLIMLDALDGRKFVKEEAQARATELSPSETESEEESEEAETE